MRHSSRNGPPPSRAACEEARRTSSRTATTSLPSTVSRSRPYGATTSLTRSTFVCAERGVNSAKPLFSQTRITGSCHSVARFTDSTKMPLWTAPSPKKTTATWSPPASRAASALPSASGTLPPTTPVAPRNPCSTSTRCIEPPEPAAQAAVAAHQLGHHALERRALRDRVAVRAMVAVHGVVVAQRAAHAGGDALLPDAEVHEPVHLVRARRAHPRAPRTRGCATSCGGGRGPPRLTSRHGRAPSTCCTASTIFASFGMRYSSIGCAVRHRRVERGHELDGRLQRAERLRRDLGRDHRGGRAVPRRLVDDDEPAGLRHRAQDRVRVERRERARVDHLGLDPARGELLGRRERAVDHPADRDDRDVAALAADVGLRRTAPRTRRRARRRARASAGSGGSTRRGCRRGSPSSSGPSRRRRSTARRP